MILFLFSARSKQATYFHFLLYSCEYTENCHAIVIQGYAIGPRLAHVRISISNHWLQLSFPPIREGFLTLPFQYAFNYSQQMGTKHCLCEVISWISNSPLFHNQVNHTTLVFNVQCSLLGGVLKHLPSNKRSDQLIYLKSSLINILILQQIAKSVKTEKKIVPSVVHLPWQ